LNDPKESLNDQSDGLHASRNRWERVEDPEDQVSLRDLAIVPLKRKRAVTVCAVIGLLAGILVTVMMTPRYRATATIELNEDKQSGVSALSDLASMAGGGADELKVKVQTETAVIEDDTIALAVMSKMGMLRAPGKKSWFGKYEPGSIVKPEELPALQREQLIQGFEANLKVKQVENSRLIAITFTSTDPVQAADVANEIVRDYKEYLLSSNYGASSDVSKWLGDQLGGLSNKVTESEKAVADYEKSHNLSSAMPGLVTLGGGSSGGGGAKSGGSSGGGGGGGGIRIPELDRLTALNEEVTAAEAQRLSAEAIYRMTESENPELISSLGSSSLPSISESTVLSQGNGLQMLISLRGQESAIKVAYADAATKYGAKNPRLVELQNQMKSLDEQIQAEMVKIKQRAKNDLTLAEQNEKSLSAAFEAQKLVTSKMNDDVVQLGILMEQASSSRELYDVLYAKLQETIIDSGSTAANITVADPARPPGKPWMPKRTLFPVAGLFGGLMLGIGLAYLQESQDDTVADSFQVEAMAHAPVLGVVPFYKRDMKTPAEGPLATESSPFLIEPAGATAEAFRSLRSGLTLSGVGRRLRLLSITSALGGEGKSFTAYNLGLAFAATGLKVLIIDADLRRPRQDSLFRVSRESGLSNLLAGIGAFDEVIRPHSVAPNIFLMSAGQSTPLASELLESGEIVKVLQTAKERFDLVLVDNAPVLPVADPIQVASHCDGTIGVMRSGQTSRKALRRFVLTLARNRIHLLGMVIEAVDMSASEYRSVYGYNLEKYYGEK
jgi:capsular exopolysaccharide synthesis family protein